MIRGASPAPWCALALAALAAGCGKPERSDAMERLSRPAARDRAEAVRALGRVAGPNDDEAWVALEKATRDPAAQVRIAAAEALLRAPRAGETGADDPGAIADDTLSVQLGDPDDRVRLAVVNVLGQRCGPRPVAYLQGAFLRSGTAVRTAIAEALGRCGVPAEEVLARAEKARRERALQRLVAPNSAQRAWAAQELGLLGRDEDVARLEPLLADKDGAVVAAAAAGLGRAASVKAARQLALLAADEVPLVAGTAAEALAELGPDAVRIALPALEKQAVKEGAQALPAALALAQVARPERLCALAREAAAAEAAALLARGCPARPLADALAALEKKSTRRLDQEQARRAHALVEALLQARPEPVGGLALGKLALLAEPVLAMRAVEAAQALRAKEAGPQLVQLVQREREAVENERASQRLVHMVDLEDDNGATRELALSAARAPSPDREKYARLMALVQKNQKHVEARADARERLDALLRGESPGVTRRKLLATALRGALALQAPGAAAQAAALVADPDREIAEAAKAAGPAAGSAAPASRSTATPSAPTRAPVANAPAANAPAAGAPAANAPAAPEVELAQARAALWSDDGAARAAACTRLAQAADAASLAARKTLEHDPERRVRAACAANNETQPPSPR